MSEITALKNSVDILITKFDDLIKLISSERLAPSPIKEECKYTLHAWLDEWLEVYKKPNVKFNTYYSLEVAVRVHIKPYFADIQLDKLLGVDLQKFVIGIEKSRTRKAVFDVLNASIKCAIDLGLIKDNPMRSIKIPTHTRKLGTALDNKEVAKFKKAIKGHKLEKYFLFLLYSGCRRSEVLTMTMENFDFKKRLIYVDGTKTKNAKRVIPMFDNIYDLLVNFSGEKYVFLFPFRADTVTKTFKKFCPKHKLHDLRHTFATRCLQAKIPLKVVQTWLGHSEINTTADIYSHVTAEINCEQAKLFNQYNAKNKGY